MHYKKYAMKNYICLLILTLIVASPRLLPAQNKSVIEYKYEIQDAEEANKFYEEMGGDGWSNKTNWPLDVGPQEMLKTSHGVMYQVVDTLIVNDNLTIFQYKIKRIQLGFNKLTGEVPDATLTELLQLDLNFNDITGVNEACYFPKLQKLNLSVICRCLMHSFQQSIWHIRVLPLP